MAFFGWLRIDRKIVRALCVVSVSALTIFSLAAWSADPDPATSIGSTSATLQAHGTVASADNPFSYWWQIARSKSGIGAANSSGSTATCVNGPLSVPPGTYNGLACPISGLTADEPYYYKFCGDPASSAPVCSSATERFDTDPNYTVLPHIIEEDMTLTAADGPYFSNDWVIIDSGVTVTVEPGADIETEGFVAPSGSTLDVQGTASDPVVFHGGFGVELDSDNATLDHAVVRDSEYGVYVDHGSPTISNSSMHDNDRYGIYVHSSDDDDTAPTISGNTVYDNGETGINVDSGGSPVIAGNTSSGNGERGISFTNTPNPALPLSFDFGTVAIHDNTVDDNDAEGIYVVAPPDDVVGETLEGNTATDNAGKAIVYSSDDLPTDVSDNPEPSGNGSDAIWLRGKLTRSATWADNGYPLVNDGDLSVTSGATLTLEPGLVIKSTSYAVGPSHPSGATGIFDVWGDGSNLIAEGTASDPITFTSLKDDSIDGDTNGDGSATSPQPGQWMGLYVGQSETASSLDQLVVRYAIDGVTSIRGQNSITNSTVRRNSEAGITVTAQGDTLVSGNTVSDNDQGIVDLGGSEIADNEVTDNANEGVLVAIALVDCGVVEFNIHDNSISDNGGAAALRFAATGAPAGDPCVNGDVSAAGNTITDNAGKGLVYDIGLMAPDIDDNTLSGNGSDSIWLHGTFIDDATWENRGNPIVIQGLSVEEGTTLTIEAGVVVKSDWGLWVVGALNTEGTAANPVVLTSLRDDSVGGDTNGDGTATQPAEGDWGPLWFVDLGRGARTGALDQTKLSYFDEARIDCPCSTPPHFRHASITNSGGLVVDGEPVTETEPIISWSKFRDNSSAIRREGWTTGSIVEPHNDFGVNGGKPAGTGDGVGDGVETPDHTKTPDHQQGKDKGADPIGLATGEFTLSMTDLRLTGKSLPLELNRTYGSQDSGDAGFGPGWAMTGLIATYEQENGDVLIRRSDGREDLFTKVGGDFDPPSGVHDTLEKLGSGTYELTTPDQMVYAFDETGRIATITDAHDQTTTYGYNSNGRLATITDSSGQELSFSYNASNHITEVADSTGRSVSYSYDADGNLTTVTDPLDGVTTYDYDSQHRLTSITDPRDNTILQNTYDSQGRVIEQHDGLDNVWTLDYSPGQTQVTDPEDGTTTYEFDSQLRMTSETDPLNHTTTYDYNSAGDVTQIVRPGGAESDFSYDADGNLTQATDPEGGENNYSYDSANHPTSYTDPRDKTWSYDWTDNDLTTITDPDDNETEIDYDSAGLPTAVTDANEHTTSYDYDSKANLTSLTDSLDAMTTYAYDARNYLTSVQEPGKAAELYDRSALGDVLSTTTPEGHQTDFEYDANGFLVKRTDPASNDWTIQRDAMEHPTAYVDPADNQTSVAYDGNLNPTQITDRRNKVTTLSYDADQQLTGIERPEGESWQYGYDARDNLTAVTDPRSNATTYSYDLNDRLTEADQPLNVTTSYGYDEAGNLTSVIDPRANETDYSYDDLGQLNQIDQPLGKTTSFAYDPVGNRTSRTTALGSVDYAYDAANRLTEISSGSDALRTFAYDDAGRLTQATDVDDKTIDIGYDDDDNVTSLNDDRGQSVTRGFNARDLLSSQTDGRGTLSYAYDDLGRLASMTDPQSEVIDFGYDPEGNLTSTQLPNGVETTNSYDGNGRMLETSSANGSTAIDDRTYSYDDAGNRASFTDRLNQTTSYSYDALDRLREFDPPGTSDVVYDYDDAGNRIQAGSTTYTYNDLNQLSTDSSGTDYTYDDAGRLVERDDGTQATAYSWDPLDQLTGVDDGTTPTGYTYDGLGRRSQRTQGSSTETAHYGDLSDMPILDTGASGVIASYIQGPTTLADSDSLSNQPVLSSDGVAPIEPNYSVGAEGLIEQSAGAQVSFPLPDAHGDITTLTDDIGSVASRQEYDPWGIQTSGPTQEMGQLGEYQRRTDSDSGLIQMGVRSYDPSVGQFLSEDPVLAEPSSEQSWNLYGYVWDNPLNRYDLDGRCMRGFPCISLPSVPCGSLSKALHCVEDANNFLTPPGESPADRFRQAKEAAVGLEHALDALNRWIKPNPTSSSAQNCLYAGGIGAYVGGRYGPRVGIPPNYGTRVGFGLGCGASVAGAKIAGAASDLVGKALHPFGS